MNNAKLLITAVGPDRVGFVDEITGVPGVLVSHGANVEESRMGPAPPSSRARSMP
ncbi:MAG: hypothetical protein ACE15E_25050 [Acidobacteriota bacterium]